jgi:excisionase family DNA binding protein
MDTNADVKDRAGQSANRGERARAELLVRPLLLTITDAARALAVERTTTYELITAGAIEVVHIGRSARVPVAALEAFVEPAAETVR